MTGLVTLSDAMLIAAKSQSGERLDAMVEEMVLSRSRLVYQIAYSVLRDHHDAEDATQETFLRVLRFKAQLVDVRDQKSWLARIAWRVAVDRARERGKSRNDMSIDDLETHALKGQLQDNATDALRLVAERQMQGIIERVIPSLPEDLRSPLLLSTVKELDSPAIAEILGIPEATVRTRLMRARQMLKEKVTVLLEKRP